jgi:sugar-specific transcriptional regulator TrmB
MDRFEVLREIGLNKTGVRCYVCLLEQGPATACRLAKRLKLPQTNLYGVLAKLTEQGFVSKFKMTTQPALFTARPLDQALSEYYMHQRRLILELCRELGLPPPRALPPSGPIRRPKVLNRGCK